MKQKNNKNKVQYIPHSEVMAQIIAEDPNALAEMEAFDKEYEAHFALYKARQQQKLTLKQLAAKSGIPYSNISNIENGKANMTINTLSRLAAALDHELVIKLKPKKTVSH